jgi:integrase
MKRPHGTGTLYVKWGSYYGRWIAPDGRRVNRKIGDVRVRGESRGITRGEAERGLRQLIEAESRRPAPSPEQRARTVDEVADAVRERITLEGARLSYRQNCESMQRIHISPGIGARRIDAVTQDDVERLAWAMLRKGLAPKTVRNVISFLHSTFALAEERGRATHNPMAKATRPRRRRGDATSDLQFLSLRELDAVIDHAVVTKPAVVRRARPGPAPPLPRDVLGPVLRPIIHAAAVTGLRQSELIGLRWRDVAWAS